MDKKEDKKEEIKKKIFQEETKKESKGVSSSVKADFGLHDALRRKPGEIPQTKMFQTKKETKKESKGVSPEEFFKNIGVLTGDGAINELKKILSIQERVKQDFFDHLINEGVKAIAETIISKTDNVEIETENQRIRIRINFK